MRWAIENDAHAEQIALAGKRRMMELLRGLTDRQAEAVRRYRGATQLDLSRETLHALGEGVPFCCEDMIDPGLVSSHDTALWGLPWDQDASHATLYRMCLNRSAHLGPNCTQRRRQTHAHLGELNALNFAAGCHAP